VRAAASNITPLPVPAGCRRVLLFGGMFDPPHLGHVELPTRALNAVFGDAGWLLYVPAARSPHKPEGERASAAERVAMLELALSGRERGAIWTDELDRAVSGEPSYWIVTVERARALLGTDADLRFLIGADQAVSFHRWRGPHEIIAMARPVVLLREPWTTAEMLVDALHATEAWRESELATWRDGIVDVGTLEVSSSTIRRELEEHLGVPAGWMDRRVVEYIEERKLYNTA